jgi:hypothetical protein
MLLPPERFIRPPYSCCLLQEAKNNQDEVVSSGLFFRTKFYEIQLAFLSVSKYFIHILI